MILSKPATAASLFLSYLSLSKASPMDKRALSACSSVVSATPQYDYIVIGAGAGGGPLAARLALNGFKVLLLDGGVDPYLTPSYYNFSIPLYLGRAEEDPIATLAYEVGLYAPGSPYGNVTEYYPRAQALGGSAVHNALLNVDQSEWDFNNYASLLGDSSWNYTNIKGTYMKRIENVIWTNASTAEALGHGVGGWLTVDFAPTNLLSEYPDQQLVDIVDGIEQASNFYPAFDMNTAAANGVPGTAIIQLTKETDHTRSSVRTHLNQTLATKPNLVFSPTSYVTQISTCQADATDATGAGVRAYGVQYSVGEYLIPASISFTGKSTGTAKTAQAKYEVILAGGFAQTPQLLMLSGIGDPTELAKYNIPVVANSPGVGKNFQDRIEISINWKLKNNTQLFNGCQLGDDPNTDPCLEAWLTDGHTNVYGSGAGLFMNLTRSSPSYPYIDIATIWSPAYFRGYYPGFSLDVAEKSAGYLTSLILKGHSAARGTVNITGNSPFDKVVANKNLYSNAQSLQDLQDMVEAVKVARAVVQNNPTIWQHIEAEEFPGPNVQTDEEIAQVIAQIAWGHHACCTAHFGPDSDPDAVLDNKLKVKGVHRLRVVDNSIWPVIPALFVTTPIYAVSEKAADMVISDATALGWKPSP